MEAPAEGRWSFEPLTADGWAIIGPTDEERHREWTAVAYGRAVALDRDDAERIVAALNSATPETAGQAGGLPSKDALASAIQAAYDHHDDHRKRHPDHSGACQDDWPDAERLARLVRATLAARLSAESDAEAKS